MASFMSVSSAGGMRALVGKVQGASRVVSQPFAEARGQQAAKIMRTGTKGVRAQFVDQTEYRLNTSSPWARTKPFGSRKAGKTMLGSGGYKSAFLGGAGSITRVTPVSVEIGVDAELFPQVKIHQGNKKGVTVKPTAEGTFQRQIKGQLRGKKGNKRRVGARTVEDYKMRIFLGMTYGVWMSRKRVKKGFFIPRRRVSVSSAVRKEVLQMLKRETNASIRGLKLTTKASR